MNKIKFLRELNNLSQGDVAEKLFMNQNTYSRYEADPSKLTSEHYDGLSKLYSVPVEALKNEDPFIVITNNINGYIQTQFNHSKDLLDKLIESKNETIKSLQAEVEYWRNKSV